MIRDITLGQYYQTDSVLHRLDCRVKLVGTLAFIISLFVVNNVWGYLLAALFNAPSTISGYYQAEVNHDLPQYAANDK